MTGKMIYIFAFALESGDFEFCILALRSFNSSFTPRIAFSTNAISCRLCRSLTAIFQTICKAVEVCSITPSKDIPRKQSKEIDTDADRVKKGKGRCCFVCRLYHSHR